MWTGTAGRSSVGFVWNSSSLNSKYTSNRAGDQTAQTSRAQVEGIARGRRINQKVHSNTVCYADWFRRKQIGWSGNPALSVPCSLVVIVMAARGFPLHLSDPQMLALLCCQPSGLLNLYAENHNNNYCSYSNYIVLQSLWNKHSSTHTCCSAMRCDVFRSN